MATTSHSQRYFQKGSPQYPKWANYTPPQPDQRKRQVTWKKGLLLTLAGLVLFAFTMGGWFPSTWFVRVQSLSPHSPHANSLQTSSLQEKYWTHEFNDLTDFTLEEHLDAKSSISRQLTGRVHIERAPHEQDSEIAVKVTLACPSQSQWDGISVKATSSSILIENASPVSKPDLSRCVLDISISVAPGLKLAVFKTDTRYLGIDLEANLRLSVSDVATLRATSSSITSHMEPSSLLATRFHIETASGGITGGFSQLDTLDIKSNSGTLNITPFPDRPSKLDSSFFPSPDPRCNLVVSSSSGSVHIDQPIPHFGHPLSCPDYTTDIHTSSGSISGTYILGSKCALHAHSGGIRASILPMAADAKMELITESNSGGVDIDVMAAYGDAEKPVKDLWGRHATMSGSLKVEYPRAWEGEISAKAVSGSIRVDGEGVEVEDGRDGGFGKSIRARKGNGNGELSLESMSGSVVAHIRRVR